MRISVCLAMNGTDIQTNQNNFEAIKKKKKNDHSTFWSPPHILL